MLAAKVKFGTIISSPFLIPIERIESCRAAVPLETAKAYLQLNIFLKLSSKISTYLPCDEIQLFSKQSIIFSFSFFPIDGFAIGILYGKFESA